MLWIDSGSCTLAALKQLTPAARITICNALGLPGSPVASTAQAARILQHINDRLMAAAGNAAPAGGGPLGGGGAAAPAAAQQLMAAPPPAAPIGQAPPGAVAAAAPAGQDVAGDGGARAAPSAGGEWAAGHGGADDEVQIRLPSHIDALVTTVQRNIAHGMPWRDARSMVKDSGIPIPDGTPHGDVASKLLLAVWAAEVPRTASTVRALDDHTQQHILAALQVDGTWSVFLQDAYINSVLQLCRESCWALDPNLSHGLLSVARRGALAFLSQVQAQTSHQPGARAQLAAALSAEEFRQLEVMLTSTGRSFSDVSVTGDTWTVAAGGGSVFFPEAKGGGGGTSSSGWTGGALSSSTSTGGLTATSMTSLRTGTMPALAQAQAEEQLLTLRFDVHALMSPKESSDLKARQKSMAAGVGDKRERSHPEATSNSDESDLQALAQYPWNQRWKQRPSLSLSMLGRALRVGLTFCNEHCSVQITTLVHLGLKKDQDAIYSEFCAAANGDASGAAVALCIIPRVMSYASNRAKAVLQDAEQQAQAYPASTLFAFAAVGRRAQEESISRYLEEVVKRITIEASAASPAFVTACTILMYQEFLAGWMAPVFSFMFCDDLEQRWRLQAQASAHQGGGGNTSGTPRAGGGSGVQGGGGGGGGGRAADGAGTPPQGQPATSHFSFRRTIQCTIDIVGNTLGVPHQVACKKCKPAGRCHPPAECPARWHQVTGSALPGFDADGARTAGAWFRNKEPIKSTIRAWIALIKDHSKWNGSAPVPAGVHGAPGLAEFEGQLARAPEKP